mmetsp:Transcript_29471/g.90344  ORF Transcript_29471/g.90344 Transcript_29471/m.90344 type:complete len:226 (+) Transcript_29471:887-1564(+)
MKCCNFCSSSILSSSSLVAATVQSSETLGEKISCPLLIGLSIRATAVLSVAIIWPRAAASNALTGMNESSGMSIERWRSPSNTGAKLERDKSMERSEGVVTRRVSTSNMCCPSCAHCMRAGVASCTPTRTDTPAAWHPAIKVQTFDRSFFQMDPSMFTARLWARAATFRCMAALSLSMSAGDREEARAETNVAGLDTVPSRAHGGQLWHSRTSGDDRATKLALSK